MIPAGKPIVFPYSRLMRQFGSAIIYRMLIQLGFFLRKKLILNAPLLALAQPLRRTAKKQLTAV